MFQVPEFILEPVFIGAQSLMYSAFGVVLIVVSDPRTPPPKREKDSFNRTQRISRNSERTGSGWPNSFARYLVGLVSPPLPGKSFWADSAR